MKHTVANGVTLTGTFVAVLVTAVQYLIPAYPAEEVDPLKLELNLAIAQYGAVIFALMGAAFIAWKQASKVRRIRILILILAIGVLSAITLARNTSAKPTSFVSSPESKYRFTSDWVSRNESTWVRILGGLQGKADIHALEIGSFEGRSALWFLENILTHRTSTITCVDIFASEYEGRFDRNMEAYGIPSKVVKIKAQSEDILGSLKPGQFDFIYIDGSHLARDVMVDAVLAWRLLKPGGYVIFDDYAQMGIRSKIIPHFTPKIAIDAFLHVFGPYLAVVHREYQIVVRKNDQTQVNLDTFETLRAILIGIQRLLG